MFQRKSEQRSKVEIQQKFGKEGPSSPVVRDHSVACWEIPEAVPRWSFLLKTHSKEIKSVDRHQV